MARIFFFTDTDLIDNIGGTNQQIPNQAFGPQTANIANDSFLLGSVHRSNNLSVSPHAYAITDGYLLAHRHPDNIHVTIFFRPVFQPDNLKYAQFPKIRYFIYRGVRLDSLFVPVASINDALVSLASAGQGVDIIDYIWNTYPESIANGLPAPASTLLTVKVPGTNRFQGSNTPVDYCFNIDMFPDPKPVWPTSPKVSAGDCIGLFDSNQFSVEIVTESISYIPRLSLAEISDPSKRILTVDTNDTFYHRHQRDEVIHYIDPAAFYGNLFNEKLYSKKSSGLESEWTSGDQIMTNILAKFHNRNKVYIDIRNEINQSVNYFKKISNNYYSIYSDTNANDLDVRITTINTSGSQTINISPYANIWPLIVLDQSSFPSGNSGTKNIIKIELPKGNNSNPLSYISCGYVSDANPENLFAGKKLNSQKNFIPLKESSSTHFGNILIDIPNNPIASNTLIPSTYIRLKYQRKLPDVYYDSDPVDSSLVIPPATEPQFPDNLFFPLNLEHLVPTAPSGLVVKTFEEELYVDLHQKHHSNTGFISSVGLARDSQYVTFFAVSSASERKQWIGNVSKKISHIAEKNNGSNTTFLEQLDKRYWIGQLVTGELRVNATPVSYYSFKNNLIGRFLNGKFNDPAANQILIFQLDNQTYSSLITIINTEINSGNISADLPITLSIISRNDRNGIIVDDRDDAIDVQNHPREMSEAYISFIIEIKGFNNDSINGTTTEVSINTGIQLFGKISEQRNKQIQSIFTEGNASAAPSELKCDGVNLINGQFRPDLSLLINPIKDLYKRIGELNYDDPYIDAEALEALTTHGSNIFSCIYPSDFQKFISLIYNAAFKELDGQFTIAHYSSYLMYRYVLQYFIVTDHGNNFIVNYTSNSIERTDTISPPLNSSSVFFLPDQIPKVTESDVQLIFNESGTLRIPKIVHQGILLETSLSIAVWLFSYDLDRVQKLFKELYDYRLLKIKKEYGYYTRFIRYSNQLELSFPFWKQVLRGLKDSKLPMPDQYEGRIKGYYAFDVLKNELYLKIFSPSISDSTRRNVINQYCNNKFIKDQFGNTDISVKFDAINSFSQVKKNYFSKMALCIYRILGGDAECIDFDFPSIGNGGRTRGMFNIEASESNAPIDASLVGFCYRHTIVNNEIKSLNEVVFNIDLSSTPIGLKGFIHLGGYGINSPGSVNFSIKTESVSPITDFKIKGEGNGFTFTNDSDSQWESSPSPPSLPIKCGNFKDITKDFEFESVINNASIIFKNRTLGTGEGDEMNIAAIRFCAPPYIEYEKEFINFFDDDQFRLDASSEQKLFDGESNAQIESLLTLLKSSNLPVIEMIGGGIGRRIVTVPFDPSRQYISGDIVSYQEKIYIATAMSIVPGIFTVSQWQEYEPGQFIQSFTRGVNASHNGNIYKRKITTTSQNAWVNSEWDFVVSPHSPTISYSTNHTVLKGTEIYTARKANSGIFNINNWRFVSQVETDDRYNYDSNNNYSPDVEFSEEAQSPANGSLKEYVYHFLRYAHASIRWDAENNRFVFIVEAYASPLRSRLDQGYFSNNPNKLAIINDHTIYGQNPASLAKLQVGNSWIPSYNQVLTALRCWGMLKGIRNQIVARSNNDPEIISILDSMFASATVQTTHAGPGVIDKFINQSDYDTLIA
jgi:hypothetical protein